MCDESVNFSTLTTRVLKLDVCMSQTKMIKARISTDQLRYLLAHRP